jgi:hypothetical protein
VLEKRVLAVGKGLTIYRHVCAVRPEELNAPIKAFDLDTLDILQLAKQLNLTIKPSVLNSVHIGQILV